MLGTKRTRTWYFLLTIYIGMVILPCLGRRILVCGNGLRHANMKAGEALCFSRYSRCIPVLQ